MSLKFWLPDMPITDSITKKLDLSGKWVILIQHWVRDAIDFGLMMKNNSNADVLFLPKPYSQNWTDISYGIENWLKIQNPWYDYENWLEKEGFLEGVLQNFKNRELIIIEVWWIFANIFDEKPELAKWVSWLVEITTFWHNRHLKSNTNDILTTYSVARSPIKESEAKHVWLAVYRSLDKVLHEMNRAIVDCNITMVWYGMIWQNVCRAFSLCKWVNVFDKDMNKVLEAENDWYNSSIDYNDVVNDSDIIIASTGFRSIDSEFISNCKNWVLLVSAWSRQNEIDVEYLEKNTTEDILELNSYIKRYFIWWKKIYLFRDWKNANFSWNSCPSNSMDLIHAETLYCVWNILKWKINNVWWINETTKEERNELFKLHKDYWK